MAGNGEKALLTLVLWRLWSTFEEPFCLKPGEDHTAIFPFTGVENGFTETEGDAEERM